MLVNHEPPLPFSSLLSPRSAPPAVRKAIPYRYFVFFFKLRSSGNHGGEHIFVTYSALHKLLLCATMIRASNYLPLPGTERDHLRTWQQTATYGGTHRPKRRGWYHTHPIPSRGIQWRIWDLDEAEGVRVAENGSTVHAASGSFSLAHLSSPTDRYQPIAPTSVQNRTRRICAWNSRLVTVMVAVLFTALIWTILCLLIATLEHPVNQLPVSVYAVNRRVLFLFLFQTSGAGMC